MIAITRHISSKTIHSWDQAKSVRQEAALVSLPTGTLGHIMNRQSNGEQSRGGFSRTLTHSATQATDKSVIECQPVHDEGHFSESNVSDLAKESNTWREDE